MSVWDNIGRFNKGIQDWFKDVGLSIVSGPKFVWDVVTAPFNDREEFNGLANTLRQAGLDYAKNISRPIGGVAAGIYATNKNILWEPLTALQLASREVDLGGKTKEENITAWKKAWEARQEVPLGQAYAELLPWSYGWKEYAKLTGTQEDLPLMLKENFDIFDDKQRDEAFKKSLYGGVMSGTLDFWKQFGLDVSLIGGKAVSKVRTPDDPRAALVGIDEALAGVNNKYAKMGEDFAANPSVWAQKHPWVQAGNNPGITAHLLGESSTKEEALYTMKALLGDFSAVTKLEAMKRPDIAEPIRIASGELTRSELKILLRDEKLLGKTQEEDMLELSYLRTPEEIAADAEFLKAYAKHDRYIAQLMGVAERPPVTEGIATTLSQRIGKELATARVAGLGEQVVTEPILQMYQPTPFHRLYYKLSFPEKELPSGLVNLNEGDSIKEVTATIDRLVRKNLMTPEMGVQYMTRYGAASTPEAKLDVLSSLEEAGFLAIGMKHDNLPVDLVRSILNRHQALKNGFIRETRETGYLYDSLEDSNIKIALFESQTANFYPIADFDLIDDVIAREKSSLKLLYDIYGSSINTLEAISDLWKASVLLRVGYPVRNALDSQLRIMSVVGATATLRHLGPGMKRLVENSYNKGERLVDKIDNYRSGLKQSSYGAIKSEMQRAGAEMAQHEAKIKEISKRIEKYPDDPELAAQLVAERIKYDSKANVYNTNSQALTSLEKAKIKGKKKTLGQEDFKLKSTVETPDGLEYKIHGSFGGPLGDMFRQLNSSEQVFSRVLDDYADLYGAKFASGTRDKITPDMDNYYREWSQAINTAFYNAAVVKELIKPNATVKDVARWLEESPAGREVRSRLGLAREESLNYVATTKGFIDNYMPSGSGIVEQLYKNGSVSEEFLREAIKDPSKLPIVHGFLLEENINRKGAKGIRRLVNRAFKVIGSMPEDAWARNPLFDELYRRSAQRRFETAEFLNKKSFTGEEFQKIAANIEAGARADALKGVKEILYNVERRTNLAQALRFIAPFLSAQENAIKTWMRIGIDKPYIFNRAATLWYAPNSAGLITDENGDPIPPYKTLSGEETIWLQIPPTLKNLPIIGPGLVSMDTVGISKKSIDVVFMGNPFNLGVGPYFGLSASYLIKLQPSTSAVLEWAFPYGPDTSLTQFLPTWARRQIERAQGMDNSTYSRMFTTIWLNEQQRAREQGLPYKSDREIKKMTDALYNTRTWANLILPFAPQFQSPYRMYIEKYRQYSQLFGLRADELFLRDYPEFFSFALSLSENRTGSGSTMTDVSNAKRYADLIAEIKDDNPALIGLITRGSKKAAFSPTAYWWQEETAISPGTAEKFRGALDPKEAIQRNQAREGWVRFRKIQSFIDATLRQRGLSSIEQAGAEDLQILKEATISRLASKIDPETGNPTGEPSAWYIDYRDIDGTKTARTVAGFKKIVQNPTFMNDNGSNPTWKSVIIYLQMRDLVASKLANRPSQNIDAKENADLKILISSTALKLKSEDIGFSDLYDRYLSQDKVYDKYLGVGK